MMKMRLLILFTILGLALLGCNQIPGRESLADTPTDIALVVNPVTKSPTFLASPTLAPSLTVTVEEATPITRVVSLTPSPSPKNLDGELSRAGPWWTFSTSAGLFAVNADGSELHQFHDGEITQPFNNQTAASPHEGFVAYIVGEGLDATLKIKQLPWPTLITEKPLFSYQGEINDQALRAVIDYQSPVFSPDGLALALVGAIEGPTSDLYVYSLETYKMQRLSDGPSQAYQPVWSPDGETIIFIGASNFGSGAGVTMTRVWAARADGSEILSLYEPTEPGSETIIGWLDNETFLVYSWDAVCGPNNLRTFNILSKESTILWAESFQSAAYDPINAVVLLSSNDGACSPAVGAGFYLVTIDGLPSLRVLEFPESEIVWSPDSENFLATSNFESGVIAFSASGQFIDLDMPLGARDFPSAAPETRDLAWPGEGLWIGPFLGSPLDNPAVKIFDEPVDAVTWMPDGEGVMFLAESGLFKAYKPEFIPELIAGELGTFNGYAEWLIP